MVNEEMINEAHKITLTKLHFTRCLALAFELFLSWN